MKNDNFDRLKELQSAASRALLRVEKGSDGWKSDTHAFAQPSIAGLAVACQLAVTNELLERLVACLEKNNER
jgi:hypothetical protein